MKKIPNALACFLVFSSSQMAVAAGMAFSYGGVATYDRQPAAMDITVTPTGAVTGTLSKVGVCKDYKRLTSTNLTLTGTLTGPWEGAGTINGTWTGGDSVCGNQLTAANGYPQTGTFTVSKQGNTVKLLRTGTAPLPSGLTYDFGATGLVYSGGGGGNAGGMDSRAAPLPVPSTLPQGHDLFDSTSLLKGDPFNGGLWANAKNGFATATRDLDHAVCISGLNLQSAGSDMSTQGAGIKVVLSGPSGSYVALDVRDAAINRQFSPGGSGNVLPPQTASFAPFETTRVEVQMTGNGWFMLNGLTFSFAPCHSPPAPGVSGGSGVGTRLPPPPCNPNAGPFDEDACVTPAHEVSTQDPVDLIIPPPPPSRR